MKSQQAEIKQGDIVKIVAGLERGKFARILRVKKEPNGELFYTLKVNNYWNSTDNVKLYGQWDGLLWNAIVLTDREIELKQKTLQHPAHPLLRSAV
jgi:hypothetical protein